MFWFSFFFCRVVAFRISNDSYSLFSFFVFISIYLYYSHFFCMCSHNIPVSSMLWCFFLVIVRGVNVVEVWIRKKNSMSQTEREWKKNCLRPWLLHKLTMYRPYKLERLAFALCVVCLFILFWLARYKNWEKTTLHDQMIFLYRIFILYMCVQENECVMKTCSFKLMYKYGGKIAWHFFIWVFFFFSFISFKLSVSVSYLFKEIHRCFMP